MLSHLIVTGLMNGCLYGLAALGLVLVYKATAVINLAHGEMFMIGGFLAYTVHVMLGQSYLLSLLAAVTGAFLLGLLVYGLALRSVMHTSLVGALLATIGLSFVLKGLGRAIWGGEGELVPFPPLIPGPPLIFGDWVVLPQQLAITGGSIIGVAIFLAVFRFTRLGKLMQAVAENARAARLVGIRLDRVYGWTLAVSGAAAGFAAALMAPVTFLYPDVGFALFIKVLAAAAVGGLSSISGALVGGIVIGVAEQLTAGYISSGLHELTAFLIIIVAFLFFPSGLFGARAERRV